MFDTRISRYKLKKLTDDFFEINNARLKKKKEKQRKFNTWNSKKKRSINDAH